MVPLQGMAQLRYRALIRLMTRDGHVTSAPCPAARVRHDGEYLSGSWLLRTPFFTIPPEQNDNKRRNNTEDQEAPQGFVVAHCVPEHDGEPYRVPHQRKPEDSPQLFPVHSDPNIAQVA